VCLGLLAAWLLIATIRAIWRLHVLPTPWRVDDLRALYRDIDSVVGQLEGRHASYRTADHVAMVARLRHWLSWLRPHAWPAKGKP